MALQVVCHDLRRTLPPLTPGEHQYRLAELNFISLIEGIDLILIHQLTIDFGAIRTSLIAQGIVAIAGAEEGGRAGCPHPCWAGTDCCAGAIFQGSAACPDDCPHAGPELLPL